MIKVRLDHGAHTPPYFAGTICWPAEWRQHLMEEDEAEAVTEGDGNRTGVAALATMTVVGVAGNSGERQHRDRQQSTTCGLCLWQHVTAKMAVMALEGTEQQWRRGWRLWCWRDGGSGGGNSGRAAMAMVAAENNSNSNSGGAGQLSLTDSI